MEIFVWKWSDDSCNRARRQWRWNAMHFFSSAAGWYIQNYNYQLVYFASLSNDSTKEVQSFLFHTLVTMSHRCKRKKREISSTHEKVLEASQEDSSLRFCRLPYILCAQSKRVEPMINATRYLLYSCKCSLSSLAYHILCTLYGLAFITNNFFRIALWQRAEERRKNMRSRRKFWAARDRCALTQSKYQFVI